VDVARNVDLRLSMAQSQGANAILAPVMKNDPVQRRLLRMSGDPVRVSGPLGALRVTRTQPEKQK
jgi:hypothetical protein